MLRLKNNVPQRRSVKLKKKDNVAEEQRKAEEARKREEAQRQADMEKGQFEGQKVERLILKQEKMMRNHI